MRSDRADYASGEVLAAAACKVKMRAAVGSGLGPAMGSILAGDLLD
jgi:hypothetical protein